MRRIYKGVDVDAEGKCQHCSDFSNEGTSVLTILFTT